METDQEKSYDPADYYGGRRDMSFIDTCTEMLISAIKNGSVYKQYCTALKAVNKIPRPEGAGG